MNPYLTVRCHYPTKTGFILQTIDDNCTTPYTLMLELNSVG